MKHLVLTAAIAAISYNVYAQNPPLSVEDRMAEMESQILLIKKGDELASALRSSAGNSSRALPTVLSVSVVGNKRLAYLQLANGRSEHYAIGTEIQNNITLASIELRKVVVLIRQGKKTVPVALEMAANQPANPVSGNNVYDPARQQPVVPTSMLPPPPVVQLPTIKSMQTAAAAQPAPTTPLPAPMPSAAPLANAKK